MKLNLPAGLEIRWVEWPLRRRLVVFFGIIVFTLSSYTLRDLFLKAF